MFLSFDLLVLLAWMFVSTLLPGTILSFAIFHKSEFTFLEKVLIGFALGYVVLPLIPFISYLFLGIKYSYTLALVSVGILYLIAFVFFVKNRVYENLTLPDLSILVPHGKNFEIKTEHIVSFGLLIVLLVTYLVRIGSYGPVFMELDPYYYTYAATQLLTLGENPMNDSTSWYPDLVVDHRIIPTISYSESIWYSLYTGGGEYDNMLLATIASTYPPFAAVLAVFFIYLLVSTFTKKEFGLIAAALVSFVPVFIYKLAAGEQEVQPYAFFALFFFYSMYLLSIKKKDLTYPILAGLAWLALSVGSSSQIVALVGLLLFMIGYSALLFIREENADGLKDLLKVHLIIFIIGPLFGSAILKSLFEVDQLNFGNAIQFLAPLLFMGVLYLIKQKITDKQTQLMALGAIIILGVLVYVSPLGSSIKSVGRMAFEIATYRNPLDKTIAEQNLASDAFGTQIGFIAQNYSFPTTIASASSIVDGITYIFLAPFSLLSNFLLMTFVSLANLLLGTSISYTDKDVSLMLFWFLMFVLSAIYAIWRFMQKKDDGLFLFFAAIFVPPFIVGILKAKYTIYAGVLLAMAVAVTLGYAGKILSESSRDKFKSLASYALAIGLVFVLFQFVHMGLAPSLLWGAFQTLYQNDPTALAAKFSQICAATNDSTVCAAAADPIGFANQSPNNQYDQKLCALSIYSDWKYLQSGSAPSWESISASLRCSKLSDYWIDSMEWINSNLEPDARIISWWDYGHWINYFGQRNAVIRNEHLSNEMIGAVADGYLDSTPEELKSLMESYGSKYALFDIELVIGGNSLGGKYSALNYLSCAYNNETTVLDTPGWSACEAEHLWEAVLISSVPCTISNLTGKTGITAYHISVGGNIVPYYPSDCIGTTDTSLIQTCKAAYKMIPTYCIGETTLATGETYPAAYYLNETYPNGDLKLNKAYFGMTSQLGQTVHLGQVTEAILFYTKDALWLDNGVITSGYEDRKGKFYDSALYQAIFLNYLPGFELVYSSSDNAVKIFKIADAS